MGRACFAPLWAGQPESEKAGLSGRARPSQGRPQSRRDLRKRSAAASQSQSAPGMLEAIRAGLLSVLEDSSTEWEPQLVPGVLRNRRLSLHLSVEPRSGSPLGRELRRKQVGANTPETEGSVASTTTFRGEVCMFLLRYPLGVSFRRLADALQPISPRRSRSEGPMPQTAPGQDTHHDEDKHDGEEPDPGTGGW